MKQLTLAFFLIIGFLPLKGLGNDKDSVSRPSEVIISLKSFNGSSIEGIFTKQIFKEKWIRFGFDYSHHQTGHDPSLATNFLKRRGGSSASMLLGIDRHRTRKSLEIISGYNLQLGYGLSYQFFDNPSLPIANRKDINVGFIYGIGAVYGIYYNISESFSFGSSVFPLLEVHTEKSGDFIYYSAQFNLMDIYLISLRYRF